MAKLKGLPLDYKTEGLFQRFYEGLADAADFGTWFLGRDWEVMKGKEDAMQTALTIMERDLVTVAGHLAELRESVDKQANSNGGSK